MTPAFFCGRADRKKAWDVAVRAGVSRAVVAAAYGGPEVLSVIDVPTPEPGPGEVRIQVRAAGVNPIDIKLYGGAMGHDPAALPKRLGFEVAGVVTAVGPDVASLQLGDEVIAWRVDGGYASDIIAPADVVVAKPANLGWPEAAGLLLTGSTAEHTLVAAGVGVGDTVLVHGAAGGVGQLIVQLAVGRGAKVIGTASPGSHELLRALGATPVAYGDGLAERVRELGSVDAAIDTVGTDEAVDVSLELVADRGRIVTIAAFGRAHDVGIKLLGRRPGCRSRRRHPQRSASPPGRAGRRR